MILHFDSAYHALSPEPTCTLLLKIVQLLQLQSSTSQNYMIMFQPLQSTHAGGLMHMQADHILHHPVLPVIPLMK